MTMIYKDVYHLPVYSIFHNILLSKKYTMKFTNYLEYILEIGCKNRRVSVNILNSLILMIIRIKPSQKSMNLLKNKVKLPNSLYKLYSVKI